jgi:hypothetical protein
MTQVNIRAHAEPVAGAEQGRCAKALPEGYKSQVIALTPALPSC